MSGRDAATAPTARPPSAQAIATAVRGAGPAAYAGGTLLGAVVIGSAARGAWRPGDDVDVRALYAMPATALLGLDSYADEVESLLELPAASPASAVGPDDTPIELDLVAFEVEKAARLILVGHELTLAWLTAPAAQIIVSTPSFEALAALAARRLERARDGEHPPLAPADYAALSALVARSRLEADDPR